MANDSIATVAIVQPSITEQARIHDIAEGATESFADRAETIVRLISRWAGVATLAGTLAVIAWLIF